MFWTKSFGSLMIDVQRDVLLTPSCWEGIQNASCASQLKLEIDYTYKRILFCDCNFCSVSDVHWVLHNQLIKDCK